MKLLLYSFLFFICFIAGVIFFWPHIEPLPDYGNIRQLALMNELVDQNQKQFSTHVLDDKIWVANFIFTRCQNICPIMSQHMSELYRSFKLEENIIWVSFTVDPDYDEPSILHDYVQQYEKNPTKWYFLTGLKSIIHRLSVEGFHLGSFDNTLDHSNRFVLIDSQGKIRGYYHGTEKEEIQKLFKDMAQLLDEIQ